MRPSSIQYKYADTLAKKRRRARLAKGIVALATTLAVIAAVFYVLFFTGWLKINSVEVRAEENRLRDLEAEVNKYLDKEFISLIPIRRNIVFLSSDKLEAHILNSFDGFKSVSVEKEMPHKLIISTENRQAVMIWCFEQSCRYIDSNGEAWGQAPESSGFLIPVIIDKRGQEEKTAIGTEIFYSIQTIFITFNDLKIPIKNVSLSSGAFEEVTVETAGGWPVYLTSEFPIADQLKTLSIFLSQKKNQGLVPEYMDLRIPGRVYYKVKGSSVPIDSGSTQG